MQKKIMLDASTIQPVQLQYANEILGWMLQLFNLYNYKMLMIFLMLDASTNLTYTTTKWMQIQKGGPTPPICTKKIWLAICAVAQVLPIS